MERILISMNERHGAWEALSRSISLAKRIGARLYVLLVLAPGAMPAGHAETECGRGVQEKLELLIEAAKADGIPIEYFVAEGNYEEEVIQFVESARITLYVAENGDGDGHAPERDGIALQMIRHRISCRVELVSPRKQELKTREESQ